MFFVTLLLFIFANISYEVTIPAYCTTYVQIQSGGLQFGGGDYVRFYINNNLEYTGNGRGIHFALLNAAGTAIEETKRFQTGSFGVTSHVRDMANWLNSIPNGRYVLGGIQKEAAMYMTIAFGSVDAYNALKSIGAKNDIQFWLNDAYAIIGQKGASSSDDGIKSQRGPSLFPGKVDIHGCIGGCGENGKYIRAISQVTTKGNKAEIYIDGNRVFQASDKGTVVRVLDKTGNLHEERFFNRSGSNSSIKNYVATIPHDYTVIAAVKGSSTSWFFSYDFFESCGGRDFSNMLVDEGYALIGKKGMSSGQGISEKVGCCGVGKIDIEQCIHITPCAPQCGGQCSGSPDNCTGSTCQANRINFSTCDCPSGTYSFGDILECQPCAFMCTECTEYANQCVGTCSHPTRDSSTSDCACIEGYYQVDQDIACQQCDYTCKSCETTSDNCLECSTTDRDINNSCQCKAGMYEDSNGDCQPCDSNCDTCENSADNCTSCAGNRINDPICECPSGTLFGTDPTCATCNFRCTECTTTVDQCAGACSHSTRDQNTPNCACLEGYYQINSDIECQECSFQCKSCETTSDNCQECSSALRDINNNCECQSGYYNDSSNDCQSCPLVCGGSGECSGPNGICTGGACSSNRINYPSCQDCPSGTFEQNSVLECQNCDFKCTECTNQADQCVGDCSHSTRDENTSNCACKIGFFQVNQEIECQECDYFCESCEGTSSNCIQCSSENRDIDNDCKCKKGFFEDENNTCQPCDSTCEECISESTNCTVCSFNRINDPTCECPSATFSTLEIDSQAECQQCDFKCTNCTNTSDTCVGSCSHSTRDKNSTNCECKTGYYQVEQNIECEICDYKCESCETIFSNCLQCSSDLRDINNSCHCKIGYYEDQSDKQCKKCSSKCIECENQHSCTVCKPGLFRNQDDDCTCQVGYFEDTTNNSPMCQKCSSHCKSCESENVCIECLLPILKPPFCILSNLVPFFELSQENDQINNNACDPICLQCDSQTTPRQCTQCRNIPNRDIQNPPLCECLPGFHDQNNTISECLQCHEHCETCSENDTCDTCKSDLKRELAINNQKCECITGYKENSNKECQKCYQFQNECYFQCPENTIQEESTQICIQEKIQRDSNISVIMMCSSFLCAILVLSAFFSKFVSTEAKEYKTKVMKNTQQDQDLDDEKKIYPQQDNYNELRV